MSKQKFFVWALALTVALGCSAGAFASDQPACCAGKAEKAAPAADAAKAKPKTEVKCEVTGKLEVKTGKNKKGEELKNKKGEPIKVLTLTVAKAAGEDGKALDNLTGKKLRVAGKKGLDLASQAGKEVTIKGTLVNGKRLAADSVK